MAAGEVKELPIILKADVGGSAEVLRDTLEKLSTDKVTIRVLRAGVGAINESDVDLAVASNAIVVGFNVRPERNAAAAAEQEKVDVRLHTIIYELIDEMKKAMSGLLAPVYKEIYRGRAEVREVFRVSKVGAVAGCWWSTATFPATRRSACCATMWWFSPAKSARCAASKTTSAKSAPAWNAVSRSTTLTIFIRATSSKRSACRGLPTKRLSALWQSSAFLPWNSGSSMRIL
jgi:hypothetical protein